MFRGNKQGFTIIETVIFLAISGLLVAVAMMAIGSKQEQVQFTDSMRSLQSFVETQFSAAQSGVNDVKSGVDASDTPCSATTGGNSGDCVVLGRIMTFEVDSSVLTYYTLLGDSLTADDEIAGNTSISYSDPRLENIDRTFNIPWGIEFKVGNSFNEAAADFVDSHAFAFLRAPRSVSVTGATYKATPGDSFAITKGIVGTASTYNNPNIFDIGEKVQAYYCFATSDDSQVAVLALENTKVNMHFQPFPPEFDCS